MGTPPGRKGRHCDFFLGAPCQPLPRHRQAQNRLGHCQEALDADALEDTDPQGRVSVQSGSAAPDQDYRQRAEAQTVLQRQNVTSPAGNAGPGSILQPSSPPLLSEGVTQDDGRAMCQCLEPLARVHGGLEPPAGQERLRVPQTLAGQSVPPIPPGPSSGMPGLRRPHSRRHGAA